jgi:GT2 family glycosyltransferase
MKRLLAPIVPPCSPQRRFFESTLCRFARFRENLLCFQTLLREVPAAERIRLQKESDAFSCRPLISILLPLPAAGSRLLPGTVASVQSQVYAGWQLCIVAGPGEIPHISDHGLENAGDPRVKIIAIPGNGSRARAFRAGLESASGQFVTFLDCGDLLDPLALTALVRALQVHPEADILYSDEAAISALGFPSRICYKPGFSPDHLLSCPFLGRMLAVRADKARRAGGTGEDYGDAYEYDLVLRVASGSQNVIHIPQVLYYARGSGAPSSSRTLTGVDGYLRALREHLQREQIDGTAEAAGPGQYRIRRRIRGDPLVSLIIPTKDRVDLLRPCIDSIYSRTTYSSFEVLVIDNQSRDTGTMDYFSRIVQERDSLRVIPYDRPFHPSAIKNAAAGWARGEHLLFLNNDIEVISPDWIESLLEHSQRDEVACAGTKLLYPDRTIQHAGVVFSPDGRADHIFRFATMDSPGYLGGLSSTRNFRAVTGACMIVKRRTFEELGGFDEAFRVGFGDLDLCMRAHARGYLNVYTPHAELFHHESASIATTRAAASRTADSALFLERWRAALKNGDPYYNPNLPYHGFCLKYR